ncbi:cysteine--tRNA ligase [Candidatus Erwinia haradaeae]|uniref:Cysteine--tRNA ligase n=1 Tax=Candidatus Erwinia haradaeae TaxID=1922217 RepID=A0A451D828_9GAMM|nr:cysteine--tRNA ligase [Candidatus Erwinia haradaeae]VFP82000.1 Cysteine--tRNA ligase [Candidatus Erwinia haradaeae]
MLKIFNTLTRRKEIFKPIHHGKVGMYVCGMTVDGACHLGHARTFVTFDMIARYLRYIGYQLNYVRNITDLDDKIIQRSFQDRKDIKYFTQNLINKMHQDFSALNILPPTHEPRVTHHIKEIIELVHKLIILKYAYLAKNGDVMFSIKKYLQYGILSRQDPMKLQAGIRVKLIDNIKRNPIDFVLWKVSKDNEPSWPSPWGPGRPGWHIECSAINYTYLGDHFDIHGGGSDLIFPHHENELAQSSSAYNTPYVNYWIHSGIMIINRDKMSKSLNNFLSVRDILKRYDAETIRYFLMSSHYRSELHYNEVNLNQARFSLQRLYIALRHTDTSSYLEQDIEFETKFHQLMNDDFNTPGAYSVLFNLAREINYNKIKNPIKANNLATRLRILGNIIGLLEQKPEHFLKKSNTVFSNNTLLKVEELLQIRVEARKKKDWNKADTARKSLSQLGILLEDGIEGTEWRRK